MSSLNGNISWQTSAAISALACITSAVATKFALGGKNSSQIRNVPEKWLKVGIVKGLAIYPVKSCKGIQLTEATVTQLGLRDGDLLRDRVFMVVNGSGTYQVQTKFPKMALISMEFTQDGCVTLNAPSMPSITFGIPEDSPENKRSCKIFFQDGLRVLDCGDQAAHWFQKFLDNETLRLVYHHEKKTQRNLSEVQKKFTTTSASDLATFQNYTSYLVIAQESIDELNKHVDKKVDSRNFRPSILVSETSEAFSEIRWGVVKIGNVLLKASKACERCKLTTVDPDKGVPDLEGEPLKTLSKMIPDFGDKQAAGLLKNKGIMGLQMGLFDPADEGKTIKVGDGVFVALL